MVPILLHSSAPFGRRAFVSVLGVAHLQWCVIEMTHLVCNIADIWRDDFASRYETADDLEVGRVGMGHG